MAWQTPKTNWSAADGVRDTDMNRIEENTRVLYSETARADTTIFVTTSGNDTSGAGTSASPYRTITKALSVLPKNLGGRNITINVGAGTYAESVSIRGFSAGTITFMGVYNASAIINSLTIVGCSVVINTIRFTVTNGNVSISDGATVLGTGSIAVIGATTSVFVSNSSTLSLNTLVSTNATSYALSVDKCSNVAFLILDGIGNTNGILAQGGSVVSYNSFTMIVSGNRFVTYTGGRIYTGSQSTTSNTLATATFEG